MTTKIACLRKILVACTVAASWGIRGAPGSDYLVPDYHEQYYYSSLSAKIAESMSINNCTLSGVITTFPPKPGDKADMDIQMVPPPPEVLKRWGTQGHERHSISKVYFRSTMVCIFLFNMHEIAPEILII